MPKKIAAGSSPDSRRRSRPPSANSTAKERCTADSDTNRTVTQNKPGLADSRIPRSGSRANANRMRTTNANGATLSGVAVRVGWQGIEPTTAGVLDWTVLDSNLAVIKAKGKFASLYLVAQRRPTWLVPGQTYFANDKQGIFLNIVVGIVGAFLGGLLLAPLFRTGTINQGDFSIGSLFVSFLGAIILLAIVNFFRRRRGGIRT